jgi:hypothetical protein
MPKQHWTTAEQRKWLEDRLTAFLEAQQADTLSDIFFPDLYDSWHKLYPIQPVTPEELEKASGDSDVAKRQKKKKIELVSPIYTHNTRQNDYLRTSKSAFLSGSTIRHVRNRPAVNVA